MTKPPKPEYPLIDPLDIPNGSDGEKYVYSHVIASPEDCPHEGAIRCPCRAHYTRDPTDTSTYVGSWKPPTLVWSREFGWFTVE